MLKQTVKDSILYFVLTLLAMSLLMAIIVGADFVSRDWSWHGVFLNF